MVARTRVVVVLLVVYTVLEVSLDHLLVYLNLTGRGVPSVTLVLLGFLGVEFAEGSALADQLNRVALVFGLLGLLFVLAAIWQLVSE